MKIKGLDYNTQREQLIMPEYGRAIQSMVDHCMTIKTKALRQRAAESIVHTMDLMTPKVHEQSDRMQKFWDHLAIMSNFQLDIDYPCDVSGALKLAKRPSPLPYPMKRIPVRHYGSMMFEAFEQLKQMPAGKERDDLTALVANQMKRDLMLWTHGSTDDEKVASDLARFTDGKIQLDLKNFKFAKISTKDLVPNDQRTGKRKRK